MLNMFVSQKSMSILHGISGKRCDPSGYVTPVIWGVES